MVVPYPRLASICGVSMVVGAAVIARLGDLSDRIPLFLLVFALLFAVYLLAVVVLPRLQTPVGQTLALIWIVAIACRAILLGSAPSLSDDIYRYLWEGRVVAAGHNPFAHAPDAALLEGLRDQNYAAINHKHMETIYPPLAQGVFAVAALLRNSVIAQKFMFMLFDLGVLAIIMQLLRQREMNPALGVVYAWSPLVLVEFAHSGHMDAIAIFFLLLAIMLIEGGRVGRGMMSMGLAFLAKLSPVILVPYFLVRRHLARWLPAAVALVVLGYLPFAGAGAKLWASLGTYGRTWYFNSLVYQLLAEVWSNGGGIRLLLAAVVAAYSFFQARREQNLARFAFTVIACTLLLSPTVYPWYVTWVVPFLCIFPSRAWLYFSGVVMMSYVVWVQAGAGGDWRLGIGFLAFEYIPFYAILILEFMRWRKVRT